MRPRFNPVDGQLYIAGLRGWQTSAARDACFQRVRYTGKPANMVTGLKVTKTGLDLTFTDPVDAEDATDPDSYEIEQWNYLWCSEYGSDDYSAKTPDFDAKVRELNRAEARPGQEPEGDRGPDQVAGQGTRRGQDRVGQAFRATARPSRWRSRTSSPSCRCASGASSRPPTASWSRWMFITPSITCRERRGGTIPLPPSPLAGEGRGEGSWASVVVTTDPSPQPSPARGEGAGEDDSRRSHPSPCEVTTSPLSGWGSRPCSRRPSSPPSRPPRPSPRADDDDEKPQKGPRLAPGRNWAWP